MSGQFSAFILRLSIWAVPTLFAIVLHEIMHGVAARALGDDTALRAGRLTLNPLAHIDPFGTVILPAFLMFAHLPVFGYAKPVPVDFSRLTRSGRMVVAAAGPLTNLVLALLSAAVARRLPAIPAFPGARALIVPLFYMMRASVAINVLLAVFNLIPLLPLDGGRVLASMLPRRLARGFARLEPYGFLILIVLLYSDFFERLIYQITGALTGLLL